MTAGNLSVEKKNSSVWLMAVDPFSDIDPLLVWRLMQAFVGDSKIHAAYVLVPSSLNWTGEFNGNWIESYRPLAKARLDEFLPATEVEKSIVLCDEPGDRAAVLNLIKHAELLGATCIVVATHARAGIERVALGSFTETLILASPIPVLVFNPGQKIPQVIHKILVPVDFAKDTEEFAGRVAEYARALNAEVVLFHKQSDPLDPVVQQGVYSLGGGWISMQKYMDVETTGKTKLLERLESAVHKQKVQCTHLLDSSPGGLVESVDRAAQEMGADMITVLTRSGPWSSFLLGSAARGLVRNSSVPVLVQRARS